MPERFLEQARDRLNIQDAVRLDKKDDESRLLAINIHKVDAVCSLHGNPLLIQGIARTFGVEYVKPKLHQKPSTTKHKRATMNH